MFLLTEYDYVPSVTEASHRYGNLSTGDPSTTENSAYGLKETNDLPEASHCYGNLSTGDPSTTENSAYGLKED